MSPTWLHISDSHIRVGGSLRPRRRPPGSTQICRKNPDKPDLIFATGDIAHSDKPTEYDLATKFFDNLLRAANLDRKGLFVIPGNYDVEREFATGLARTLSPLSLIASPAAAVFFGAVVWPTAVPDAAKVITGRTIRVDVACMAH